MKMKLLIMSLVILFPILFITAKSKETSFKGVDLFDLTLEELTQVKISVVSNFNENIDDVMASVHHIDKKEWQVYGAIRNRDAITQLPSVINYTTLGGADALAIRGYAQPLSVRGLATLIDGISMNNIATGTSQYGWEFISLGLVDNIDLVLGPGSVQNGSDAFHGTLSFNTYYREKNENKFYLFANSLNEQRATWQYSTNITKSAEHFINIAVDKINKNNTSREHWSYVGDNNQLTRVDLSENYNITNALFKLHNKAENKSTYQLKFLHSETLSSGFPGGGELLGFVTKDESGLDSEMNLLSADFNYSLSPEWDTGVKSHVMLLDRDINYQASAIVKATHDINKLNAQIYSKYKNKDNTFRIFTSVEYSHQKIKHARITLYNTEQQPIFSFKTNEEGFTRSITSVLLQGRQKFTSLNTDIELGVRLDKYSDSGSITTPRIGIIKHWNDKKQKLKILYGNAFRAPVSAEIKGSTSVLGNPNIKPETIDMFEIIYSHQLEKGLAKFTLFKSSWKDGINVIPIEDPLFASQYANIGAHQSQGIEVNYHYESESWRLNTDLSYTDSEDEFRKIKYTAYPKYIWNAQVDYIINSKSNIHIKHRILDGMTTGHNSQDNQQLPTYVRVDLGYQYQFSNKLSTNLAINNLFNHKNRMPSIFNSPKGVFTDEINIAAELNYQF